MWCAEVPRPGAARRRGPRPVRRRRHASPTSRSPGAEPSPRAGSSRAGRRALPRRAGRDGAVAEDVQEQQALTDRDAGALLLRDCGSAADTPGSHERDDLPRLIRAGRHIARTKRYIRNYAHEIEPDELPAYVAQEAAARRRLGQARRRLDRARRRRPDAVAGRARRCDAAIAAAHEQGARVTAHVFGEDVAARPDRRRHRLHRARHRAVGRPGRRDGRATASRWCRP